MRCERCKDLISQGQEKELHGQVLCEDCYIDLLSPLKACDPWAVHSAKTFIKDSSQELELNSVQRRIIEILKEKGPAELRDLSEIAQIKETDLERQIVALRHMEKVRGEIIDGKRMIRLW
jgi:hypothetical protein